MRPSILFRNGSRKYNSFSVMAIFYKMIQVLCCLDFGFFEHTSKIRRITWKSITVLQAMLLSCVYIYMTFDFGIWFIFYLIYYITNVVILVAIPPNATYCQLHRDLRLLDLKQGAGDGSYNIEKKILLCNVVSITFYLISGIFACLDSHHYFSFCVNVFVFGILIMRMISFNLVFTSVTFVFFSLYCRLKTYASILKATNRTGIYQMKLMYKSIADLTETYKSAFDALFISVLIFTTIELMGQIIVAVKEISYANTVAFKTTYPRVFIHLATIFAPALCAEMIAAKASDIKLILHEKLLNEEEPDHQRELEQFIRYMEARPLRFRVYRVIPLDASLLGMVLNFAVTYLIVIIQFMNK